MLNDAKKLQRIVIGPVVEPVDEIPSDGYDLLHTDGIRVQEVSGVGRDGLENNLSGIAGQQASVYKSTQFKSRQIGITMTFDNEAVRQQFFNKILIGEPRCLYLETKSRKQYWIVFYPGEAQISITKEKVFSTLLLDCPYPFFRAVGQRVLDVPTSDYSAIAENDGDAPAWPIWDFDYTNVKRYSTSYTGTDGDTHTLDWHTITRPIAKDPYFYLSVKTDSGWDYQCFYISGLVAGAYVNFMPGERECRASKVTSEYYTESELLSFGVVECEREPDYTDDNRLDPNDPTSEIDTKAIEAWESEQEFALDVQGVKQIFAPIRVGSEWLSIPPDGAFVHCKYNKNTPEPWGKLKWYDTYTTI